MISRSDLIISYWLFLLLILAIVSLIVSTYLISALNGTLTYPSIYFSHAFQFDPSRAIAAFLLPVIALLVSAIVTIRQGRLYPAIGGPVQFILWVFVFVWLVILDIGLVGLGAVTITTQSALHYTAAGFIVIGGALLVLTDQMFNELTGADGTPGLKLWRWSAVLGTWAAGIAFAITIGLSDITASIMEFLFVFFFLMYLLSYLHPADGFPLSV
jgi:hypothetical protein